MRMKNMNILSKNVMRYGHILRQDLRPFGELKFLNFLFYLLIFLLMRLNFYPSVSVIKELFQFFFNFTFKITQLSIKIHSCIFLSWVHEFLVTHANTQALVLTKKVMRYGHIFTSVQVKNDFKKVRLGYTNQLLVTF